MIIEKLNKLLGLTPKEKPKEKFEIITEMITAILENEINESKFIYLDADPEKAAENTFQVHIGTKSDTYTVIFNKGFPVQLIPRAKKEVNSRKETASIFLQKNEAELWVEAHHKDIVELAKNARTHDWESFTIDPRPVSADAVGNILVKTYGFLDAKNRRGKVLVCMKPEALKEKPRRSRKPTEKKETEKLSAQVLRNIAENYFSDNFARISQKSMAADSKEKEFFTLEPKIEPQALPYLRDVFKSQGYRMAKLKNRTIYVYFEREPFERQKNEALSKKSFLPEDKPKVSKEPKYTLSSEIETESEEELMKKFINEYEY